MVTRGYFGGTGTFGTRIQATCFCFQPGPAVTHFSPRTLSPVTPITPSDSRFQALLPHGPP